MDITASDKSALLRLAASLPKGHETRRALLSGLKRVGADDKVKEASVRENRVPYLKTFSEEFETTLEKMAKEVSEILPGWIHTSDWLGMYWRHPKLKTWFLEISLRNKFRWLSEIKASAGRGRPPFWMSYERDTPSMFFEDGEAYIHPLDVSLVKQNIKYIQTQPIIAAKKLATALELAKAGR